MTKKAPMKWNGPIYKANQNESGLFIRCATTSMRSLTNRFVGELLIRDRVGMEHILVIHDLNISIQNALDKTFSEREIKETKYFSFFDPSLATIAVMETKFTDSGNLMFNIKNRFSVCNGLYGYPGQETKIPEPACDGMLSYPCFFGFSEFDKKYIGIIVEALHQNKIDLLWDGFRIEKKAVINLEFSNDYLSTLDTFNDRLKVHQLPNSLKAEWVIEDLGDLINLFDEICNKLDMKLEDLYKIKIKTDYQIYKQFKLAEGQHRETVYSAKNDYGIDRCYQSHELEAPTIAFF